MAKLPRSIKLSMELEREVLSLSGTFVGSNKSEIITYILTEWFKTNRTFVIEVRDEIKKRKTVRRTT